MDRLACLGKYAVLLLGLSDITTAEDFQKPVSPSKGLKLDYLKAVGEGGALIDLYELNPQSPRFGLPTMYSIKIRQGTRSSIDLKVHYSRVIHVAYDSMDDDVEGLIRKVLTKRELK